MTTTPGDGELGEAVAERDDGLDAAPAAEAHPTRNADAATGLAKLEFLGLASDPAIGAVCSPDDPDCIAGEAP